MKRTDFASIDRISYILSDVKNTLPEYYGFCFEASLLTIAEFEGVLGDSLPVEIVVATLH